MDGMQGLSGTALRWTRAVFLAAVAMCTGAMAHASADGILPGKAELAALLVVCTVGAAALLGRPASTRRVLLLLLGCQTFIHAGLTVLGGHRGDPLPAHAAASLVSQPLRIPIGTGRRTGSLFDQLAVAQPAGGNLDLTVPYWLQHVSADMTGQHALMAVGHLAAGAVVGLWLAAGERALWTLVSLTAQLVVNRVDRLGVGGTPLLAATVTSRVGGTAAFIEDDDRPPDRWVLSRNVTRRGPPYVLAA